MSEWWEGIGRGAAWLALVFLILKGQSLLEQWAGSDNSAAVYGFLVFIFAARWAWSKTLGPWA